jgi:polyisoprenoid-binding protein YceI
MQSLKIFGLSSVLLAVSLSAQGAAVDFGNSNTLKWTGTKLAGAHDGTVKLKEGKLDLNGKADKGRFVFDMKSIQNSDLQGEWKTKLEDHLKSADFFDVQKHPEAVLVIKELKADAKDKTKYEAKGDLTIKGITKPLTFPATITQEKGKTLVNAKFTLNRLDWDIRYNSGKFFDPKALGDKLILDDIGFESVLTSN